MKIDWDAIKSKIEKAVILFHEVDHYGVTHIASADGNLDDENLEWIRAQFFERPPAPKDIEFMDFIEGMTEGERILAYELYGTVAPELTQKSLGQ
jgi:hypothetical protein